MIFRAKSSPAMSSRSATPPDPTRDWEKNVFSASGSVACALYFSSPPVDLAAEGEIVSFLSPLEARGKSR